MFWTRLKEWLGFGKEDVPPPDPRLEKMLQVTNTADRLGRLIAGGHWKGRRTSWRTAKLVSVHPDIYSLIHTMRTTTHAVISKGKPTVETRLSRRVKDNLYEKTLDAYLIDEKGMSFTPDIIMLELLKEIRILRENIMAYETTDDNRFDYYLRQCTNLFDELEYIIKAYL